MNSKLYSAFCSLLLMGTPHLAWAAEHPEGNITFYNASNKTITAQVSSFGKVNISAKEGKVIKYSSLSQLCSGHAKACTAEFYVNNSPAGTATINVETGRIVKINLMMKVRTTEGPQQVLRRVVIQ